MTLPVLRTKRIQIDGIRELQIREMSAGCYVEWSDARGAGKDPVDVCAIIARHCVPDWSEHTCDEIKAATTPGQLSDIAREVLEFTGITVGNSDADQPDDLSSS